ncbi:hypothetical protein T01_14269 [Trichinella spiralis]|uniref:Uncharacterized protein n=1 Tax=Trichinella spiralis TaxID=6334 RepID=A0A0V1B7C2_TRISP|nr:hypothetical protein T01_14269 [Trichinella spiralis]
MLYKCYYDHEHRLESAYLFSYPLASTKITSSLNIFSNISANTHLYNVRPGTNVIMITNIAWRARIYFRILWLLLKSHHHSTFFPISQQIRIYTTCDQKVLESFTANKPVGVE